MFMINGLILAVTSLILSGAGVWLNLFLVEHLSEAGMGLYQLILSVYTFAVTLSSAGIHLTTTRVIAEELARSGSHRLRRGMTTCMGFSLLFGASAGLLLYVGAPWLGETVIGAPAAVLSLRLMAFTLPVLSVCATVCGYFTAVRRVYKTAVCNVLEQGLRIVLVVAGVTLLVQPQDVASGVIVLSAAGLLAEVLSFGLEYLLYKFDSHRYEKGEAPAGMVKNLVRICIPVAFSSYLRSGLTTTKNLLVPSRLLVFGLSNTAALSMFGAVHGVALPVILFPAAILGAFSGLIIPEVAESHTKGQSSTHHIQRLLTLNLSVSLGVGAALFVFAGELGAAVSQNPDVAIYIRLLAPVAPVMYLDTAVDCLLKGMDEQVAVMRYNVYDAVVSLAMVWVLLPWMGIKGYILMVILSEVFNLALSYRYLVTCTGFELDIIELVAKPLLCGSAATLGVRGLLLACGFSPASPVLAAAVALGLSAAVYTLLLLTVREKPAAPLSAKTSFVHTFAKNERVSKVPKRDCLGGSL